MKEPPYLCYVILVLLVLLLNNINITITIITDWLFDIIIQIIRNYWIIGNEKVDGLTSWL